MGRKCFVPTCRSGYASSDKRVRSFKAPRDPKRLKAWAKAIGRTDKPLTPDCYVCEEHFPSSAVKKQKYFGEYKGNILLEHPKRSVLEENAVPSLKLSPATDTTTETWSSMIVDKPSDMSAASSDQSQDDGEGSPEKAARVDGATSPVIKKTGQPVKNSDASGTGAPDTQQELAAGALGEKSSMSTVPKNAPLTSTPMSTMPSTVALNSSSPFLMQTTAPARFTLSSAMSAVSPMTGSPQIMLQRTSTPFSHIGAPSTLTLNRTLPPMALNSSPSTLLLMPVALIPKPGDSNSPAGVAMRVVPGNAQMATNHPPGKMTTTLAFRLTAPTPAVMKKPVAVPAAPPAKRRNSQQQKTNDFMVKDEVLSEESGDSPGGSSDDGGGIAEPTSTAKKMTSARTLSKAEEANSGAVRLPLSMALGADQVLLPSPAWNHHDVDIDSTNSRSLCFVELQCNPTSGPPFTRRILQIVQSATSNYSIKCYVLDREVEVTDLPTGAPAPTVEEIAETLQDFNSRTVCRGGLARKDLPGARFERAWLDKTGVWRHDRCPLLLYGGETLCKFCASLPNPFNPPTTSTIDKSKLQQQKKHGTRSRVKAETLKL